MKEPKFKLFLCLFIFLYSYPPTFSQDLNVSGSTITINVDNCCSGEDTELANGQKQDFTIPASVTHNTVTFNLRGGDGGFAKAGANCKSEGGDGATVNATFIVGHGTNQLKPGGKIRFIVGKHGYDDTSGGTAFADGGGGGGTAVLYQPAQNEDWVILAVAGGGGGAYQGNLFGGCLDSQKGQGGRVSESGGSGAGSNSGSGGTNGNGGGGGDPGQNKGTGGGGGAFSDGGDGADNWGNGGIAGYPNGGNGGLVLIIGFDPGIIGSGGWGFGGGGAAFGAGGGGGGYSGGGGGGKVDNGGGGGSYVNSTYDLVSEKSNGGASGNTDHGYVTYQFKTICTPQIDYIEEISGFCGSFSSPATVQAHLTTPGGCDGVTFFLSGAGVTAINQTGLFTISLPGSYILQLFFEVDGVVSIVDAQGFFVLFDDTVPPVARCKNATVSLTGSPHLVTNFENRINNGSTDNCGIASLSSTAFSFSCSDVGNPVSVTLTATDQAGNTSTCTANVTVRDNQGPSPDVANLSTITDECTLSLSTPTATDFCDGAITGVTNDPVTYSEPGTYTVNWTYTDSRGNSTSQQQTVIINDQTAPDVSCPNDITVNASANSCEATVNYFATATDNCDYLVPGVNYTGKSPSATTTVPAGQNRLILAQIHTSGQVSGITYNGQSMTLAIRQGEDDGDRKLEIWYLPLGSGDEITATAQITSSGGNPHLVRYTTFENVNQDNPIGDTDGRFESLTVKLNTRPGDLMYEGYWYYGSSTAGLFPWSGQTVILKPKFLNNSNVAYAFYKSASGGTQTLRVTNDNGIHVGLVLQANHTTQYAFNIEPKSSFPVGTTLVSFTATDAGNNSSNCSFNVTVRDNQNPTITCPDNFTVNAVSSDQDICTAPVTYNAQTADNCGSTSLQLTSGLSSGADFPVGTTMNTLVVTDAAGLTASCSFEVTVVDASPPEAYCQDFNLFLDASGNGDVAASQINNNSYDLCGSISELALDVSNFDCNNLGANSVVLTVTDENGNSSTCSATIQVQERVAPTALCQDQTVQLDANGEAATTAEAIDNGSSDVCGLASVALNNNNFTCENLGTNPVMLIATDNSGNTATCLATITVEDNVNPTAICQNVTIQLDANGTATTTGAAINNNSFDNCQVTGLSLSQTDFSCSDVNAANTITLTVTDGEGLQSTCTASVTVEDQVAPTAQCQSSPVILYLDENGTATLTPGMIDDNSSDNCGAVSLEFADGSTVKNYDCSAVNAGMPTPLHVIDQYGNQSSCSTDIFIADNLPPVVSCQDITVQLDATGSVTVGQPDIDAGSTDNCGSAFVNQAYFFDCGQIGANTATFTFRDISFNTSQCTVNITVEDNLPPTAICQDVTIQLDENGDASTTTEAINNNSFDNCTVSNLSLSQTSFSCDDVAAANLVTLTVSDGEGLQSTCSASVTVEDQIAPTAQCHSSPVILYLDENGTATLTPGMIDDNSSDNCGAVSLEFADGSTVKNYDCSAVNSGMPMTLNVIDQYGNQSSCSTDIIIADNLPPVVSCQDITVQLDATGSVTVGQPGIDAGSTDNCGSAFVNQAYFFECGQIGANTATFTFRDISFNTSQCTVNITVEDNLPPTAICQDVTIQLDENGDASTTTEAINSNSFDNCTVSNLSLSQTSFSCDNVAAANLVTLTVTDGVGLQSTCSASVTVEDQIAPTAQCQDVTLQLDENGQATATPEALDNGSSDACGIGGLALTGNPSFDCTTPSVTLSLVVTDQHGNNATCSAVVTVEDITRPDISCPNDEVIDVAADQCSAPVAIQVPVASDNCAVMTLKYRIRRVDTNGNNLVGEGWSSWNTTTQLTQVFAAGHWKVQWQAKDAANNQRKCSYIVEVRDLSPPKAICQDLVVEFNGETEVFLQPDQLWNELASADNCGDVYFVGLSNDQVTCDQIGSNLAVVITIEDNHGNTSECTANVSVTGLPCNWKVDQAGLGCTPGTGDYAPDTQTFTLSSQGCFDPSPYRANDAHGFIQTQLCGDGEIIAQVTEVTGNGWAGISMRESNDPSAPMIQLMIDGVSMSRRELRQTYGSYAFAHHYPTQGKNWLRLSRSGNQFTASRSEDGVIWEHVFITQIPMSICIEIGLITMNGSLGGEVSGTFEQVSINGTTGSSLQASTLPTIEQLNNEPIEPWSNKSIKLFPNPATKVVHLHLEEFIEKDVQVNIYNQFGQIVFQQQRQKVTNTTQQINISNIPPGTYIVEIRSGINQLCKKLVVTGL